MKKQPLVILIGNSLLMEGVALSLLSRPGLNVLQLEPALIQLKDCLHCLAPELVVFELGAPWSESLANLLSDRQEIRLAGLDLTTCRLVLMAGQEFQTDTMQELLQVIGQQTKQRARSPEGG